MRGFGMDRHLPTQFGDTIRQSILFNTQLLLSQQQNKDIYKHTAELRFVLI